MRVIAGEFRSRVLKTLPGLETRPTPDRLREALFSILQPILDGAVFADLYAGTGAVGIEALSRGASKAVFVEQNRAAVAVIRENLKSLGADDRADVRQAKATAVIKTLDADVVFLDPPYPLDKEYAAALAALGGREKMGTDSFFAVENPEQSVKAPGEKGCLSPFSLVLVQHDRRRELAAAYGALHRTRILKQGDNCVSFYTHDAVDRM